MKRFALILLIALLCVACVLPAWAATPEEIRAAIEAKGTTTRVINVPGRGDTVFYGQRNPMWNKMVYEYSRSKTRRIFGDGGCGPTSAAIAIANLLTEEELLRFAEIAAQPFTLCEHAIDSWACSKCKTRLELTTAADYAEFLPLLIASYASGNNAAGTRWRKPSATVGGSGGTAMIMLETLAPQLGLNCASYKGYTNDSWVDTVNENAIAVCLSPSSSPFSGGSHYVVTVWADAEYLYVMDPLDKKEYTKKTDKSGIVSMVEQGLLRVKRSNFRKLNFGNVYVLSRMEETAVEN